MSSWLIAVLVVLCIGGIASILLFGFVVKDLRSPKSRR